MCHLNLKPVALPVPEIIAIGWGLRISNLGKGEEREAVPWYHGNGTIRKSVGEFL